MRFLDHFRRITSQGRRYIPVVDGLRFVAIMAVMAYHSRGIAFFHFGYPKNLMRPGNVIDLMFGSGHIGVELFFTISGFILGLPFAESYLAGRKRIELKSYYLRRVTRLEPPYIIHLVFLLVFSWAVLRHLPSRPLLYHNPDWLDPLLHHIFASLFYSHAFVYGTQPYPNFALWSLEAEVQFYLIAPFLAMLFSLKGTVIRRSVICVLLMVSSLWEYVLPESLAQRVMLVGTLQFFLAGFLLADVFLTRRNLADEVTSYGWDLLWWLSLVLVAVCVTVNLKFLAPWLMLLICMSAMKGKVTSKILQLRWITVIGGMCYTIYMYHSFVMSGVLAVTKHLQTGNLTMDCIIQFLVMTPLVVCVSALLFLLFEKPFMRPDWYTRVWKFLPGSTRVQQLNTDKTA